MAVYVISEVAVLDEDRADAYRTLAAASIQRHGGRYLVRGAEPEAVEGTWESVRRIVIVEFPTMNAAREWYASPEYAEALKIRQDALDRRLLFATGMQAPDRRQA
jgi:uncharacterized protein (DUF1330 family)